MSISWLRKLVGNHSPQPQMPKSATYPSIAVDNTSAVEFDSSASTIVARNPNVFGTSAASSSSTYPDAVSQPNTMPASNCPDVVDVRSSEDRVSTLTAAGGDSCDGDEADCSAPDSPAVFPSLSDPRFGDPTFSTSHLSLSSMDDSRNDDTSVSRRQTKRRIGRQVSLSSAVSLPGNVSDWPHGSDGYGAIFWPVSSDTTSLSAVSLPPTVDSFVVVRNQTQSSSAVVKSTFKKNYKPSRKRQLTTEVSMTDLHQASTNIDTSPALSEGRAGVKVTRSHTGVSMKTKDVNRSNSSVKKKDVFGSLMMNALSLPIDASRSEMFDVYGMIDELEENADFEIQHIRNSTSARVRSADRLDIFTDRYSDPGLSLRVNSTAKEVAVLRPSANNTRRSRDSVHGLFANENITKLQMEKQYLCINRGQVRLVNTREHDSHTRHLFLFNNYLLIAKQRHNASSFTLRNKVRLIDIWLSDGAVSNEIAVNAVDVSFVIGWPTVNYLATFRTQDEKRMWFDRLQQLCNDKRAEQPMKEVLKIVHKDKQLTVEADAKDYNLVVQLHKFPHPVPLNGYERPLSIFLEEESRRQNESAADSHASTPRSKATQSAIFYLVSRDKYVAKPVSRQTKSKRVGGLFRKSQNPTGERPRKKIPISTGKLFGHSVDELCANGTVPKPILDLMQQLYDRGPFTIGVFRMAPNFGQTRNLREKLDAGEEPGEQLIHVAASTVKELFRYMPDSLLVCAWYAAWIEIMQEPDLQRQGSLIRAQVLKLPDANSLLLRHLLCVLCRIVRHSDENKMTSINLATCIAPSLLWDASPPGTLSVNTALSGQTAVVHLVNHLIVCAADIWNDPAECVELFHSTSSKSSEDTQPEHSSISVQTASSGSLSDSEDNKGDFENDFSNDQLSPASRDSGLVMYRYSNEELASTSGTNSPDYERDIMLDQVDGQVMRLSLETESSQFIAANDNRESSPELRKLPDLLQNQPLSRPDSGYTHVSSSSSSANAVISRTTGTARQRIHNNQTSKTLSADSAFWQSSLEEQSSVFETSEEDLNRNLNHSNSSTIDSKKGELFRDDTLRVERNGTEKEHKVSNDVVNTASRRITSAVKPKPPELIDGEPSGLDMLFYNLHVTHREKYGDIDHLDTEIETKHNGHVNNAAIEDGPGDLCTSVTSTTASKDVTLQTTKKPERFDEQQQLSEASSRKKQLTSLHSMHRGITPAIASPEIWPTAISTPPPLYRQMDLKTSGPVKHDVGTKTTTENSTLPTRVESKAAVPEHGVSGLGGRPAVAAAPGGSVVISLQPGRETIHQQNLLTPSQLTSRQVLRSSSSAAKSIGDIKAQTKPPMNKPNEIHEVPVVKMMVEWPQQMQHKRQDGGVRSNSTTPLQQRSLDEYSGELQSATSSSAIRHKPLCLSLSAQHSCSVASSGSNQNVSDGNSRDGGGIERFTKAQQQQQQHPLHHHYQQHQQSKRVLPLVNDRSSTNGTFSLKQLNENKHFPLPSEQPQSRPPNAQVTVVTVTDDCTIIERRQNVASPAGQQYHPGRNGMTPASPMSMTAQALRSQQHYQRQHDDVANGRPTRSSAKPTTKSAAVVDGDSSPISVAKLRSIYVVGGQR